MGVSQGFLSVCFTISSPLQSFHNRDAFNQAAERDTVQKWREKAHKIETLQMPVQVQRGNFSEGFGDFKLACLHSW